MGEALAGWKRSHMCCDVNESMAGQSVTVMGWVHKRRDLGQLIFIALRDRTGLLQLALDGNNADAALFDKVASVRGEYVVAAKGTVALRTEQNINKDMKTGKVEIIIEEFRILAEAEVPPFQVADVGVKDDMRLKYRYIDLRREELQNVLRVRHITAQTVRRFFTDEGFYEIETPMLANSSPEGARDYLVPSRVHPGSFYALPQSPQVFKQLLMVSGFDKYFQIVRCFRDEDLRANRQPEFTQIDVEMSFIDMDDIIEVNERLMKLVFKEILDVDLQIPFRRMPYVEAMERFGVDKPDLRYGVELKDISALVKDGEFGLFNDAIAAGGSVRGICAPGMASIPRKQIDALVEFAKGYKAKGLAWISVMENGELKTSLSKFFSPEQLAEIVKMFDAKNGDLILICADAKNDIVYDALGNLRCEVAEKLGLADKKALEFLWVTEFPLLEWSEDDGRFCAKHHPFTSPMDEDMAILESDPGAVRAKAYDIVLNGVEIGGGSVRIFQRDVQERMFKALGFTMEQAQANFGHLLDAFKYGAPPHGGIAYGLDRLVMSLTGTESIRDVIAFPKVKDASCPLTNAPSPVADKQLAELGIGVVETEEA